MGTMDQLHAVKIISDYLQGFPLCAVVARVAERLGKEVADITDEEFLECLEEFFIIDDEEEEEDEE